MQKCDEELTASITPGVMRVLGGLSFFEKLDHALSPENSTTAPARCNATYELSETILRESGIEASDFPDIFCVLRAQGGSCDCEILYNVSESNRLKRHHWMERAQGRILDSRHRPLVSMKTAFQVRTPVGSTPFHGDFTENPTSAAAQ